MKTSLRAKLVLLGIALLTVPLLIGVAEIAVRLFSKPLDPLAVFVNSPQLRSDTQGETTRGMFEFDPLLSWRLKPNLRGVWWDYTAVTTNAQHLRMARDIGAKTGLRIVALGDSVTFGYRVPVAHSAEKPADFDPEEKPYPPLLEQTLRAKYAGRNFEVLPLACPGYTSWQGNAWLERDIDRLKPDIVIACFGWNDVRAAGLPDRATMPASPGQAMVRSIMGRSQLLLSIAASAQHRQASTTMAIQPEPRSSDAEYVASFLKMAESCRKRGVWFGIVLPVYRDPNTAGVDPDNPEAPADPAESGRMTHYREQLRKTAQAANIPVLEIPELFESAWPGNRDLFGERIHPNAAGHRLMAERILEFLAQAISAAK